MKTDYPVTMRLKSLHTLFLWGVVFILSILVSGAFVANAMAEPKNEALKLISLRIIGDNSRVRIVSVYHGKPEMDMSLLATPPRLVIDLPETEFVMPAETVVAFGLVNHVRYGGAGSKRSRIIIGMNNTFQIEKAELEELNAGLWQHVIDVVAVPEDVFRQAIAKQWSEQKKTAIPDQHDIKVKAFRVVIDAGHGGIDSGAQGVSGVLEKDITLAVARSLRDALEKYPDVNVFLTRDSDVFLRLGERVAKAREYGADLFVSIHADSISLRSLRGATVYTISNKASDDVARKLAESENKTDLLDGLPADDSPAIADILLDLAQRETHAFSVNFADRVVASFQGSNINTIKNPHRYAGFQVLKAPDVPSVLVEIGYLSNSEDEKLVTNPAWRDKIATVMAKTIHGFALSRSGNNTVRKEK